METITKTIQLNEAESVAVAIFSLIDQSPAFLLFVQTKASDITQPPHHAFPGTAVSLLPCSLSLLH